MTLGELKQRVRETFGPEMRHATPANVREFLDAVARERWREQRASAPAAARGDGLPPPLEILSEPSVSYEQILRQFFADALAAPHEQALIQLWLLSLDLAYAGLQEQAEYEIGPLFADADRDR